MWLLVVVECLHEGNVGLLIGLQELRAEKFLEQFHLFVEVALAVVHIEEVYGGLEVGEALVHVFQQRF